SAQVPPKGRWSMTATERPALRNRVAATCAAVPVPITMRSKVCISPFGSSCPALKPKHDQAETNQECRDYDVVRISQPRRETKCAEEHRKQRCSAAKCGDNCADRARSNESPVIFHRA